jgi:hypothetical protein
LTRFLDLIKQPAESPFAGVGKPAFGPDAKGMINYQGDQTRLTVAVGDSRVISMNTPGSDAFTRLVRDDGKGGKVGVGFFQALGDLINSVKNSDNLIFNPWSILLGISCG